MRYRSATVAGSHGLPLNPEREKNTNGKSRGTAPVRRNTFFFRRPGPERPANRSGPRARAAGRRAPRAPDQWSIS